MSAGDGDRGRGRAMEWPQVPLATVAKEFISGGTPSTKVERYWTGDIPWITGADVTDKVVASGRKWITREAVENSATHVVPQGAVLLVTRTGVGKVAKAGVDIAISQDLTGIVLKDGIIADFIVAAIQHKVSSLQHIQQGAIIKGVLRKDIETLEIPLPPLSEQRRIVEILDQADRLRRLRAEADAKADRILPALFIKMFGDPAVLLSHPSARPLAEFGVDIQNGFACGEKDVPDGVPHLRMNNLSDTGRLDLRLVRTVPNDMASERYRLRAGDVLFMSTNSEDKIGKACVFSPPDERPYLFSNHLMRIRCRTSELTPEYLATFLHLLWRSGFYAGIAKRWVNQATVSRQALGTVRVPAFALERQRRLAKAHRELDNHVKARVSSGERLTLLFAQLLERAFSGSLTASWREAHMKELLQEMEQQAKTLAHAEAAP